MELENKQLSTLKHIAKDHQLQILILFGSYSQGTATKRSDLDLAFMTRKQLTKKQELELYNTLESELHMDKIDLININRTHDATLRKEIFEKGTPVYETKRGLFNELHKKAWSDYQDFKYHLKDQRNILKDKIEAL